MKAPLQPPSVAAILRWTYVDGVFFAIMVATAESFALFFFARQGVSATQLAVLSTVPVLVAALFQLAVPRFVSRARLGHGIVVMMALQMLGLFGLIASALVAEHFWLPLAALILYWVGGQCAAPLWLDWVAQYCPRERFESFFGRRTAVLQVVTLVFFVAFAYLIDAGLSYVWVFVVSAVARLLSLLAAMLAIRRTRGMVTYTKTVLPQEEIASRTVLAAEAFKVFALFVIAGGVFRFAVNTASPFFLPYMVNELKLSTTDYVWVTSVPLIGKVLFQINWAQAKLQGYYYQAIQSSCLVVSLLPWMWTLSDNLGYLVAVQILSGVLWGGLEFVHTMMAQNLAYGQSRKYASLQMAIFQAFALGGSLLGGVLLDRSWTSHEVFNLSTGLRLLATVGLVAFAWRYAMTRVSLRGSYVYLTTVMSVRPSAANVWNGLPVRLRRLARERDAHHSEGAGHGDKLGPGAEHQNRRRLLGR